MGKLMLVVLGIAYFTNPNSKELLNREIKNKISRDQYLGVIDKIISKGFVSLFSNMAYDIDNYLFFSIAYVKLTGSSFAFGIFGKWFIFNSYLTNL